LIFQLTRSNSQISKKAMFELQKLLSTKKVLRLETKLGRQIENQVAPPPSARHVSDYNRSRNPAWENRRSACGEYNCHGHVFAARRTSIYEDIEVTKILMDDRYRKLGDDERLKPDDILIYVWKEKIIHAARVMEVGKLSNNPDSRTIVKRALSKWNDSWGEDFHGVSEVPFALQFPDYQVETWTDGR
jgi:hypothetical protein